MAGARGEGTPSPHAKWGQGRNVRWSGLHGRCHPARGPIGEEETGSNLDAVPCSPRALSGHPLNPREFGTLRAPVRKGKKTTSPRVWASEKPAYIPNPQQHSMGQAPLTRPE